MFKHNLEVVLQPVERFFFWDMTKEQKCHLRDRLDQFVCKYCCLPYENGSNSHLIDASFTMNEEQSNIKRLHIKFVLTISCRSKIREVEDDVRRQLKKIEIIDYNGTVWFCSPDTPAPWNEPIILSPGIPLDIKDCTNATRNPEISVTN